MSSPTKEFHKVSFTPKHEAAFLCPNSDLNAFLDFLNSKHITIAHREAGVTSDSGEIIVIEVSDVTYSEGERLQSEFNALLG